MQKNEQKSNKNLRNWDFFCTFAARFCFLLNCPVNIDIDKNIKNPLYALALRALRT